MSSLEEFYFRATVVLLGLGIFGLFHLLSSRILFNKLANKYPAYYDKIGRPQYHLISFKNRISAVKFTFKLLLGVPKDFPQDSRLRRHARFHSAVLIFVALATIPVAIWMSLPLEYIDSYIF